MGKVQVAFRMDEELLKVIDDVAERSGQTRTDVVLAALERGVESEEMFVKLAESGVLREVINVLDKGGVVDAFAKVLNIEVDRRRMGVVQNLRERGKVVRNSSVKSAT